MKKRIVGIILMVLMCFSVVLSGCSKPSVPEKEYSKAEMLAAIDKAEKLTSFYLIIEGTFNEVPQAICLNAIDIDKETTYIEQTMRDGDKEAAEYFFDGFRYYIDSATAKKYKEEVPKEQIEFCNVKYFLDNYTRLGNVKEDTAVWTRKGNNVFTVEFSKKTEANTEKFSYEITATDGILSKVVTVVKSDGSEESAPLTATVSSTPKAKKTDFADYKIFDLTKEDFVEAFKRTKELKDYELDLRIDIEEWNQVSRYTVLGSDTENYYWGISQRINRDSFNEWYAGGFYYADKNAKIKKPMTESAAKEYVSVKALLETQLQESNFTNDTAVWAKKSKYVYEVTSTTSELYSKAEYTIDRGIISHIVLTAKNGGTYDARISQSQSARKTDFSDFVLDETTSNNPENSLTEKESTKADVIEALSKTKLLKDYTFNVDAKSDGGSMLLNCSVLGSDPDSFYLELCTEEANTTMKNWYYDGFFYIEMGTQKIKTTMLESEVKELFSIVVLIETLLEGGHFTNDSAVWTKTSKNVYEVTSTTSTKYEKISYTVKNGLIERIVLYYRDGGTYDVKITTEKATRKTDFSDFVLAE